MAKSRDRFGWDRPVGAATARWRYLSAAGRWFDVETGPIKVLPLRSSILVLCGGGLLACRRHPWVLCVCVCTVCVCVVVVVCVCVYTYQVEGD